MNLLIDPATPHVRDNACNLEVDLVRSFGGGRDGSLGCHPLLNLLFLVILREVYSLTDGIILGEEFMREGLINYDECALSGQVLIGERFAAQQAVVEHLEEVLVDEIEARPWFFAIRYSRY